VRAQATLAQLEALKQADLQEKQEALAALACKYSDEILNQDWM